MVLELAVVAGIPPVVILHHTRVVDTVVTAGCANAAMRLLHNYRKNEAMVNAVRLGNVLDAVVDGTDLGSRVIGNSEVLARDEHVRLVVVEPGDKCEL